MKTTFSRTFTSAALIVLAAMLLVGISFQLLVKHYLTTRTIESLQNDASAIASLASAYHAEDAFYSEEFLVNLSVAAQVSDADAVICDASGTVVLCSDAPLGCEHQGMRITSQSYMQQVIRDGGSVDTGLIRGLYSDARFVVSVPILDAQQQAIGIIIVSTPTLQTDLVLKRISNIYLSVSILVVLLSVIFMTITSRIHAKPLRQMAQAASAFGHGDLNARVSVDEESPDEVRELALAFNNMASSLQKSEYQRQEFVANVSHELKTPMTTIAGMIDGMLDGTIPPERHRHYMSLVSEETKRLSRLVRSMLDISRLQDQGGYPEEKKIRFDVCECVGQVLITFEQKINAKALDVQVDFPSHPVYTMAVSDAITQVVYNLVDNAVKFCPEQGQLGVRIRLSSAKVYVSVSNDGDTIPAQELPLVFDRFHKLDKSRSQNRDGWGLGLYIVKTLVCSHGEDISVSSQNGKTEFTFTLPLVN